MDHIVKPKQSSPGVHQTHILLTPGPDSWLMSLLLLSKRQFILFWKSTDAWMSKLICSVQIDALMFQQRAKNFKSDMKGSNQNITEAVMLSRGLNKLFLCLITLSCSKILHSLHETHVEVMILFVNAINITKQIVEGREKNETWDFLWGGGEAALVVVHYDSLSTFLFFIGLLRKQTRKGINKLIKAMK